MLYETKYVHLKNGKTCILRSPQLDDASEMVEFLKKIAKETDFLARTLEEREKLTVEDETMNLQLIREARDILMIICEMDGQIIGNSQLVFNTSFKTRHRATVMISLLQDYWGLGIGSILFEEMLNISKTQQIKQIELQVMEGNHRAIHLYRKYGFIEVGNVPNAYCMKDGSYQNELYMIKEL